jgi:hypothetical protein
VNGSDPTGLSPVGIHDIYSINSVLGEEWTDKNGIKRRSGGGILIGQHRTKQYRKQHNTTRYGIIIS